MLSSWGKEYICQCYYSRNIFLKKYNLHVSFDDQESFEKEYRQVLRMKGCSTDFQFKDVISMISEEIKRRRLVHIQVADRTAHFKNRYQPLYPVIWVLKDRFFDSNFLNIVKDTSTTNLQKLQSSISNNDGISTSMGVYQFPLFTKEMCKLLVEELEKFEKCPGNKSRPNTMNKYGVSLDEMGLSNGVIEPLIQKYLTPICTLLFPNWGGATLDSFKAFTVKYELGHDLELAQHYDNAEISINISLSEDFEGGDLHFGPIHGEILEDLTRSVKRQRQSSITSEEDEEEQNLSMKHKAGYGILHCGRRLHKALPITKGTRTNLIVWMRSSRVRNAQCPMCGSPPSLVQVPTAGEGYTMVDVCSCS